MKLVVSLIVLVASASLYASGWNCKNQDARYPRAKLYNSTTNPRVPAAFVVSDSSGTVLSARGSEISKRNLSNGVRYSANDGDVSAVLFVKHREGADAPLAEGEEVYGKLVVVGEDGRDTYDMWCARYLKN